MFFDNKANRYPHLVAFLRESESYEKLLNRTQAEIGTLVAGGLGGFGAAALFSIPAGWINMPLWVGYVLLPLVGIGLAMRWVLRKRAELDTPEIQQKLAAYRTVANMRRMLEYQRLHRDLSETALITLEETARYRNEIRQILETPFWRRHDLPDNYQRIRGQALAGADQAMLDAINMYKARVPERVEQRKALDYVDEVVETFVFTKGKAARFADSEFDGVFDIAKKLQALSEELQKTTHEAELDMQIPRQVIPGGLIDLTMHEIKNLRTAEDELRNDLRS